MEGEGHKELYKSEKNRKSVEEEEKHVTFPLFPAE